MAVTIQELPQVPEWLLALLASHLPFSLPILRRLQFARRYKGGSSPTAHVLLAYDDNDDANSPACFAAAYVDPSRGPETECWLYSTLEDAAADVDAAKDSATAADAVCVEQVLALLRRIRKLEAEYSASSAASSGSSVPSGNHGAESAAAAATSVPPPRPAVSITDGDLPLDFLPTRPSGYIKAGSLHEAVRQAILREEVVVGPTLDKPEGVDWEFNGKWLFRVEDLPGAGGGGTELPAGMRWDAVRDGADVALVQSRTIIPRSECVSPWLCAHFSTGLCRSRGWEHCQYVGIGPAC